MNKLTKCLDDYIMTVIVTVKYLEGKRVKQTFLGDVSESSVGEPNLRIQEVFRSVDKEGAAIKRLVMATLNSEEPSEHEYAAALREWKKNQKN